MEIQLTSSEMMQAALIGSMRHIENLHKRRKDFYGATKDTGWQINIEGALGEMALSKFMNVYYAGTGILRAPDVGGHDVRTRSRHDYDLILHPDDPDDRWFWLLTGINGRYWVHGRILAGEGKRPEWWADPAGGRPAYFVPQDALLF